jgi:hypothetical protein
MENFEMKKIILFVVFIMTLILGACTESKPAVEKPTGTSSDATPVGAPIVPSAPPVDASVIQRTDLPEMSLL